jgi:biopolymer transport protein ExbD
MPSVKIPRKSTATDMTPFVDVAFLILAFFMLATKFKPPAPVQITTPRSVSSDKLKEQDAVLIEFDSTGHVYFTVNTQKSDDNDLKYKVIQGVNTARNLGLTEGEMQAFKNSPTIGSPFSSVKSILDLSIDKKGSMKQAGIPVDTVDNQLATWIANAKSVFAGRKLNYMVKGDNNAKFPTFKGVIEALRKNDEFKYQLITDPKSVPYGTDEYVRRESGGK